MCGAYTQELVLLNTLHPHAESNGDCRFHRLRYKLAPVGTAEVSLGELQQIVMPEQTSTVPVPAGAAVTVSAAPSVVTDTDSALSSSISFKAP